MQNTFIIQNNFPKALFKKGVQIPLTFKALKQLQDSLLS